MLNKLHLSSSGLGSGKNRPLALRNATGCRLTELGNSRMQQGNLGEAQRIQEPPARSCLPSTAALFAWT